MSNNLNLTFRLLPTGVPGTFSVEAMHPEWPMPIGFIYFRPVVIKHVDLLYAMVIPQLRRKGVLTAMFDFLRACHKDHTFISQVGVIESIEWMKKTGWHQTDSGWWFNDKNDPEFFSQPS